MTITELEKQTGGNVAWAAFLMATDGRATPEWGRAQIERGLGDVAWASASMVDDGYATPEWAKAQEAKK